MMQLSEYVLSLSSTPKLINASDGWVPGAEVCHRWNKSAYGIIVSVKRANPGFLAYSRVQVLWSTSPDVYYEYPM